MAKREQSRAGPELFLNLKPRNDPTVHISDDNPVDHTNAARHTICHIEQGIPSPFDRRFDWR
jgi:hypothetical protein